MNGIIKALRKTGATLSLALLSLLTVVSCAVPAITSLPITSPPPSSPQEEVRADAPHIIIYTDFECGACEKFHSQVEPEIRRRYVATGKAEIEVRLLAVIGDGSKRTAEAALYARDQGLFQEFEDALLSAWLEKGEDAYSVEALTNLAASLGMDTTAFTLSMNSEAKKAELEKNLRLAGIDKVQTLPAVIIGGSKVEGYNPLDTYIRIIDDQLSRQQAAKQGTPLPGTSTSQDNQPPNNGTEQSGATGNGISGEPPAQTLRDMTIDLLTGPTWAAQTFTTPPGGWTITGAHIGISKIGSLSTALTVTIRRTDADGHPVGQDLIAGDIPSSNIEPVSKPGLADVTFSAAYTLKGNTRYALVVYSSGEDRDNYYSWWVERRDAFPGGNLEQSVDSGTTWIAQPWDTNFELNVLPGNQWAIGGSTK